MIRDLIIKTPYNPGERLPPEREIAEMLDVTRTVVREALIMLEIKGLVEVRRGAGIYVLWKNNHAEIKRKNSGRITSGGNNEKTANVNQIITIKRMSHVTNHNEDYSK